MPSRLPLLVALRGEGPYAAHLEQLRAAEGLPSVNALAEKALADLARKHRLKPPPRARRPGAWAKTGGTRDA